MPDVALLKQRIKESLTFSDLRTIFQDAFGFTQLEYDGSKKNTEYVDVGEKIGGARKDIWTPGSRRFELSDMDGLDSGEAAKLITKQNVLEGVFESIVESEPDPAAAWMMDKVFKSITPKPDDTDEARRGFVAAIEDVQEAFNGVKTINDLKNVLKHMQEEIRGYNLSPEEAEFNQRASKAQKELQLTRQRKWEELYKSKEFTLKNGRLDTYAASRALDDYMKNVREDIYPSSLSKEYYQKKKEWDAREEANPESKRNQYRALGQRFMDAVTFKSKAFVDNFNAASDKITDMSWLEKSAKKKRGKIEKPKWTRVVPESVERTGGQTREFKPKDLLDTFKIRGVEYGNWMDEESSQHHTQMLGESFLDLSDIMGIPLEQISYGGRLAIAFGARGSGGALAHYEPMKKAINMTKFNGGGSLAHEWGHFMDNVIHMVSTGGEKKHSFCSDVELGDKINPEISNIFKELTSAMKEGNVRPYKSEKLPEGVNPFWPFYGTKPGPDADAQAVMDKISDTTRTSYSHKKGRTTKPAYSRDVLKTAADYLHTVTGKEVTYGPGQSAFLTASEGMTASKKSYWTRPHEMFARAFEAYINKKLRDKGALNTYLVSGIPSTPDMPYPSGDELIKLEKIFDKLISSLKENQIFETAIMIQKHIDNDTIENLDGYIHV